MEAERDCTSVPAESEVQTSERRRSFVSTHVLLASKSQCTEYRFATSLGSLIPRLSSIKQLQYIPTRTTSSEKQISTTSTAKRGPSSPAPSAGSCATILWMPHVHNVLSPLPITQKISPNGASSFQFIPRFISDEGLAPRARKSYRQ